MTRDIHWFLASQFLNDGIIGPNLQRLCGGGAERPMPRDHTLGVRELEYHIQWRSLGIVEPADCPNTATFSTKKDTSMSNAVMVICVSQFLQTIWTHRPTMN